MVSSYSATAPEFLPEDERKERDSLSPEEIKAIQNDVIHDHDYIYDHDETPEFVSDCIQQLHDIIKDDSIILPINKAAYYEACQKVPHLVEQESNPIKFLRCENYNVELAAIRLVEYWKQRKSIFGPIKAFEAMTMNGALKDDMHTLNVGCMTILPNTTRSNRGVIFLDGAVATTLERNSVLRVWFYLVHVLTSSELVQKQGYVLINSIKGFDVSRPFDRILAKKSLGVVQRAMPGQLRVSHACLGMKLQAISFVAPQSKQITGKHIRMRSVHHEGTNEEMLESMQSYGFSKDNVSSAIGGNYTHEKFLMWVERQKEEEEEEEHFDNGNGYGDDDEREEEKKE